jgi:hypothetical protein
VFLREVKSKKLGNHRSQTNAGEPGEARAEFRIKE